MEYWSNGVRDSDSENPTFHHSNTPLLQSYICDGYFSVTSAVSDTVERTSTVPGSTGVGA
jgi:hypothetical protein